MVRLCRRRAPKAPACAVIVRCTVTTCVTVLTAPPLPVTVTVCVSAYVVAYTASVRVVGGAACETVITGRDVAPPPAAVSVTVEPPMV